MVLAGNKDESRASWFGLQVAVECVQDADDGGVSGENAEPNRGDYGDEENDRHNERIHGNQPLTKGCYQMHSPEIRILSFLSSAQRESSI